MSEERLVPKLRFAGFSDEWNQYFLSDVIKSFVNGQTPSRNVDSYWNGDIPWVSSGELNYNHITSTIEQITDEGKDKANLKLLPAGTFLMAITGLEAEGTRGSCAILDIEATTNQSCMALFPKEDKLTTKFLYYWYLKVGEHYGIKYTQGTKQQSYNKELLEKLPIVIPVNLKEQEKITDFMSLINHKIELLEKKQESYINFKKYLMQQIFAQKLRFANFEDDWRTRKLGEIVEFLDNKRIPLNEDERNNQKDIYPYYGASGVIDYVENYIFDEELILIGEDGTIDVNLASGKYWVSNHAHVLRANKDINQHYLLEFLKTVHFEIYNTGTIQPKLNKETCKSIPIKMPKSLEEQKLIANCLFEAENRIKICEKQINITNKFKKGLLQQMFVYIFNIIF